MDKTAWKIITVYVKSSALYKQSFKKNEACELFVTRNQLPDMCLSYNKGVFVQLYVPKSSHRVHPSLSFLKGKIIGSRKKYVKGNCWAVNSTQSQACENGKHSKGKENKEKQQDVLSTSCSHLHCSSFFLDLLHSNICLPWREKLKDRLGRPIQIHRG